MGRGLAYKYSDAIRYEQDRTPSLHELAMDNYLTPSLAAGGAAAAAVALGTWSLMKASRPKLPYPPGPKGRPLIGNLLDMPQELDWLTYHRMGQEHGTCSQTINSRVQRLSRARRLPGDVVHLETLGQHIVVLNSATAAVDLLDHRSAIYSSRPVSPMLDAV